MSDSWRQYLDAGNSAYEKGRVPEAEVQFLKALQEAEKFGEGDSRLALTLNNLAAAYHSQGKYTMAEPVYKRALDIKVKLYGEKHAEVALNHHNLAVLYSARKMYPLAEKHFLTALALKEELFGKESPELLITLQYYAQLMKVANRPVDRSLLETRMKSISNKNKQIPEQEVPLQAVGSGEDGQKVHN